MFSNISQKNTHFIADLTLTIQYALILIFLLFFDNARLYVSVFANRDKKLAVFFQLFVFSIEFHRRYK
jgi:hypothetical protein